MVLKKNSMTVNAPPDKCREYGEVKPADEYRLVVRDVGTHCQIARMCTTCAEWQKE